MGTNPKRTVTVQMVPQLAMVDTLSNKESNANWVKEPNLNLTQVCPTSTLPSMDLRQDNICLSTTTATSTPSNTQTAFRGGQQVVSVASDASMPPTGNGEKLGLMISGEQQMLAVALVGRGVNESGEGQKDSNANVSVLPLSEEEDICKAGLQTVVPAAKVEAQIKDCQAKGQSEPKEGCVESMALDTAAKLSLVRDTNKDVPPNHQTLNKACESISVTSESLTPQHSTTKDSLGTANKGIAEPLKPEEPDNLKSLPPTTANTATESQCALQVSEAGIPAINSQTPLVKEHKVQETQLKQSEVTAALSDATTALAKSHGADAGFTNKNHPESDLQVAQNTQIPIVKHQPASSPEDSCTPPQSLKEESAHRGTAEGNIQTDAALGEKQCQKSCHPLYREASTMTSSFSSPTSKQHHDVEVQAVANMCSKAVSTSPSLLPLHLPRKPSAGAVPWEDSQSLAVICQGDNSVGFHQIAPSQIHVSSPPTSADPKSERLTLEAGLCSNQSAGVVLHVEESRLGAKPKEPGSALSNVQKSSLPLQPVYQINIEPSSQREQAASHQCKTVNAPSMTGAKDPTMSETATLPVQAAKTPTAEAPTSQLGSPLEAPGVHKSTSADNNGGAALPLSGSTANPIKALPAATTAADAKPKTAPSTKKSDSQTQPAQAKAKAPSKATEPSAKTKIEPERKEEEVDESGKDKGKGVHDVVWDEQGMTWEVYGASVDPESLGFAIQSHLQCKIKEQERKLTVHRSIRKSITAADSSPHAGKQKRRHPNIFRSMLQNVRRPNCCARPPPTAVLE